jgi:hypothetical protein
MPHYLPARKGLSMRELLASLGAGCEAPPPARRLPIQRFEVPGWDCPVRAGTGLNAGGRPSV